MRITDAASVLRAAGLKVVERPGWKSRDNGRDLRSVRGLTVHHTAGSRNSSVEGELRVIENGRPGLSGPISQFMVARDGTWYCTAAGAANHNKVGWAGPNKGYGNSDLIGVECQHSGAGEPWGPAQYDSLVEGVAALARRYGFPAGRVGGHKEHQPGEKVDPSFSMSQFRSNVGRAAAEQGTGVSKADVIAALQSDEGKAAVQDAVRWGKFEWPSNSMSWNNLAWLLFNRSDYIGQSATAIMQAQAALAQAVALLRADVAADEATDALDRDTVLAALAAAEARLAAVIETMPDGDPPAEPES